MIGQLPICDYDHILKKVIESDYLKKSLKNIYRIYIEFSVIIKCMLAVDLYVVFRLQR